VRRSPASVRGTIARAPITLLTDFGYRDHYAGVIKGVIASIAPAATIIDITHGVPAQSITAGALALREAARFFPARTVFLAVVDPGVGTARLPIAVETRIGARFVGPDNGLLSLAIAEAGFKRAVELRAARYRLSPVSATFHGRDIFAPAAAWLWRGARLSALGPALKAIAQLELAGPIARGRKLEGTVIYVDHYGNLVTNIDRESLARLAASFPGRGLSVRIDSGPPIRIVNAYGEARRGAPLATFGSFEFLEIAVRDGSAAERFGAREGTGVSVAADG
jgi:S-adenosyl-L-methionine hydrolase (adenosine-forming)